MKHYRTAMRSKFKTRLAKANVRIDFGEPNTAPVDEIIKRITDGLIESMEEFSVTKV